MKQVFFYNPDPDSSGNDQKTDNTKLVAGPTVYVSPDGGTTDEPFPKPNVEYDFCVDVANTGTLPSGPFYVHFSLSGDQDPPFEQDFQQEAGLDAGHSVKAVVHFGSFPNEFKSYFLEACVYSASAPDVPINCAGSFEFAVNTESTDSSNSSDSSGSSDSSDSSGSSDSGNTSDSGSQDDSSNEAEPVDASSESSDDSGN
jgi:hypothetical protein